MFPPTLLSYSNHFLRALQQKRPQSRLFYLLTIGTVAYVPLSKRLLAFIVCPSYSYKLYNKSLVVERVSHQPCLDQSCARMDKTHLNFYSALAGIYK